MALSILRLRPAIGLAIFFCHNLQPVSLQANVIAERKANFKAKAAAMKAINRALSGGDFETVVTQATTITD